MHYKELIFKAVIIDNELGEITRILGANTAEVTFYDINKGRMLISCCDVEKYIVIEEKHNE